MSIRKRLTTGKKPVVGGFEGSRKQGKFRPNGVVNAKKALGYRKNQGVAGGIKEI